jgi:predicted SnoaL-like aldol condensation-catalyzing enzyme
MKWLTAALIGCFCSVALAAAASAADDNMIGLSTPNGKLVYDFVNLWFNEHKTDEAFDKYVSKDHYMNHAVYDASVNKHPSFEEEKIAEARAVPPGSRFEFKQLIAQGSLVIAHIHAFQDGSKKDDPGDEMVMILRVRNGKIVDHWDLHVPLKPDSAVFAGLDR